MSEEDYDEEEEEEEEEEEKVQEVKAPATVSSVAREIHGLCYKADSVMGQMGSGAYYPGGIYQTSYSFQPPPPSYFPPYQMWPQQGYPYNNRYYQPPPPYDYRNSEEYREYRQSVREREEAEKDKRYQEYQEFKQYKEYKDRLKEEAYDAERESQRIIDNYYKRLERSQKEFRSLRNASDLYRTSDRKFYNEEEFERFREYQQKRPEQRFQRAQEGQNARQYQEKAEIDKAMRLLLKRN